MPARLHDDRLCATQTPAASNSHRPSPRSVHDLDQICSWANAQIIMEEEPFPLFLFSIADLVNTGLLLNSQDLG